MELRIINKTKVRAEIPTKEFKEKIKRTLDIRKAVFELVSITENKTDYTEEEIKKIIYCNEDWGQVLDRLREPYKDMHEDPENPETMTFPLRYDEEKIYFKLCPIVFYDKIGYENYAKNPSFTNIVLKEINTEGECLILLDSIITDAEYVIDNWLSKSLWPYTRSKWREMIVDI